MKNKRIAGKKNRWKKKQNRLVPSYGLKTTRKVSPYYKEDHLLQKVFNTYFQVNRLGTCS